MVKRLDVTRFLIVLAVAVAAGFLVTVFIRGTGRPQEENAETLSLLRQEVTIGSETFLVEVARSEEELLLGLQGRGEIGAKEGMLFDFVTPAAYSFWMKEMKFPVDFIWVREGRVIGVTEHALPEPGVSEGELQLYYPPDEVDTVLEVNAGAAAAAGIKIGDEVILEET